MQCSVGAKVTANHLFDVRLRGSFRCKEKNKISKQTNYRQKKRLNRNLSVSIGVLSLSPPPLHLLQSHHLPPVACPCPGPLNRVHTVISNSEQTHWHHDFSSPPFYIRLGLRLRIGFIVNLFFLRGAGQATKKRMGFFFAANSVPFLVSLSVNKIISIRRGRLSKFKKATRRALALFVFFTTCQREILAGCVDKLKKKYDMHMATVDLMLVSMNGLEFTPRTSLSLSFSSLSLALSFSFLKMTE